MIFARQRPAALKTIPEEKSVHFLTGGRRTSCATALHGIESLQNDHQLINESRLNHNLQALTRTVHLDEMAEAHAKTMAQRQNVFHSVKSVNALRSKLRSLHVGENIQRGTSILQMHKETMTQKDSFLRNNVLSNTFDECGMATYFCKEDGQVYMVQLFRSTRE